MSKKKRKGKSIRWSEETIRDARSSSLYNDACAISGITLNPKWFVGEPSKTPYRNLVRDMSK